jgi:1,4-dihydroxy-6-naphthoate synthase
MKLKLGFSTCPNDTFIFDAMVHHKIDTEGIEFEYFMGDVEELNKMAFSGAAHITKISFNAFTKLANDYVLLDSGAALGENCGPLIIAASDFPVEELNNKKIAVPGFNTTANLLMEYAFPKAVNKVEMLFSDIENAVAGGRVDAGLIIHESRFTYAQKGLVKLADVGEIWENVPVRQRLSEGLLPNDRWEKRCCGKLTGLCGARWNMPLKTLNHHWILSEPTHRKWTKR